LSHEPPLPIELEFSLASPLPPPPVHPSAGDSYYADTLSRAQEIYFACKTDYLTADSVFASNEDYEKVLYPGERAEYSWFVYPKDVFELCHRSSVQEQEVTAADLPYAEEHVFVRPEIYLDHLRNAAMQSVMSDQDASCFKFTNFLGHLRSHHKQFA
jgi:hypothetical protein